MAKAKGKGKGGIQVLRIMTHPKLGGGLLAHDSGRVRPDNVREVPEGEPAIVPYTTRAEEIAAKAALQAMLDERAARAAAGERVGRMPHHAVELVFQGAGRYGPDKDGVDHSWPRENEEDFERRCLDWAKQILGPESVIAVACAHRDELTHHLHVIAIPIRNGRLGWCHVRDAALHNMDASETMHARFANEAPPQRRKGTRRYARLQDAFHDQVACFFGLDRGEKATGRRHQAIDRFEAIKHRADGEEARAQREREATAVAVEEREAAERDRDQAQREAGEAREATAAERKATAVAVEEREAAERDRDQAQREAGEAREAAAAERKATAVAVEEREAAERDRDQAQREAGEAREAAAAERKATAVAVEEREVAERDRDQAQREAGEARGVLVTLRAQIKELGQKFADLTNQVSQLMTNISAHQIAEAEAADARRVADDQARASNQAAEKAREEKRAATEKAAAAVREWSATRERIATHQRAAEHTLEETRAAVDDDRAVGRGFLSKRGREFKHELAHERQRRETAEQNLHAAQEAQVQAEARADAETKRADEAEQRVKALETILWSKQLVDEIAAERGEGSEVERVTKLRAQGAKASAPKNRPAPAPARAPTQPGRGIGG